MVLEVGSIRTSQHISKRKMKSNIIHFPLSTRGLMVEQGWFSELWLFPPYQVIKLWYSIVYWKPQIRPEICRNIHSQSPVYSQREFLFINSIIVCLFKAQTSSVHDSDSLTVLLAHFLGEYFAELPMVQQNIFYRHWHVFYRISCWLIVDSW